MLNDLMRDAVAVQEMQNVLTRSWAAAPTINAEDLTAFKDTNPHLSQYFKTDEDGSETFNFDALRGVLEAMKESAKTAGLPEQETARLVDGLDSILTTLEARQSVDEESKRALMRAAENLHHSVARVSPETVEQNEALKSVLDGDPRPRQITIGESGARSFERLGHTIRDAKHIKELIVHRDKIDLLQIDGPQYRRLTTPGSRHRLKELGLVERCFSATSLAGVVEEVAKRQ